MIVLIAALATAGTIYYGVEWWSARTMHRRMTTIERANAQIEEDRARERKLSVKARLSKALRDRGYEGDWTPVLLAVAVLYMLSAVALKLVGVGTWVGGALALPAAILIATAGLATARRKQQAKFQVQLMQALGLIATQVEAGDGAKRAIEKTVGLVEEPLRGELTHALDSLVGTTSLVSALKELGDRYPSRAMRLFVAALEIDDKMGARLAPALRQAQIALEKDFELTAEATAEVASARGEFFGITAIIGFIVITLVGSAEGISKEVYQSPIGIIVLALAGVNYLFGIWRTLRIFRSIKGSL